MSALLIKRIGERNGWEKKCKGAEKGDRGVGEHGLWFMVVVCDRYMTAAVTDRASTMCSPTFAPRTVVKFSNASKCRGTTDSSNKD